MSFSDLLVAKSLQFSDVVLVTLFIKDMANYSLLNEIYISKFAKINPPVRVCVQSPLKTHIVLEAIAYRDGSTSKDGSVHNRQTLHVQSISHWAPANVGPYSQVVRVSIIHSMPFSSRITYV